MIVRDILSQKGSEIYSTSPEATVFDAIKKMAEYNIGALLVLSDKRLVGILSERDYRNKVILKGRTSKATLVQEIMTTDVFHVTPNASIEECMAIMTEKKFRHLPVVKDDQDIVGVISIGDLVKSIIDKQKVEIRFLRGYISGSYPG
ncbi:MAG: CBS domain-containing protein [Balneolaceae bacterium]